MPRASQDYTDTDYALVKKAAQNRNQDIRGWIVTAAIAAAKEQLRKDAQEMLKTLDKEPEPAIDSELYRD